MFGRQHARLAVDYRLTCGQQTTGDLVMTPKTKPKLVPTVMKRPLWALRALMHVSGPQWTRKRARGRLPATAGKRSASPMELLRSPVEHVGKSSQTPDMRWGTAFLLPRKNRKRMSPIFGREHAFPPQDCPYDRIWHPPDYMATQLQTTPTETCAREGCQPDPTPNALLERLPTQRRCPRHRRWWEPQGTTVLRRFPLPSQRPLHVIQTGHCMMVNGCSRMPKPPPRPGAGSRG